MRRVHLMHFPLLVCLSGCAAPPHADFGEAMKTDEVSMTSTAEVFEQPTSYDGKYLRLRGEVVSVCAKKGCWLRLVPVGGESADSLFVKFTCPVRGRLIPMAAVGHEAIVEGTLEVSKITEAEARHYAEDAGKSAAEIAKIVGDRDQLRMKSPAAQIVGLEPPPPPSSASPTTKPASRPVK